MRILLVDDDTAVIPALLAILKTLPGDEVRVATTGEKAVENAAALNGVDLLITDVVMEPMDGFTLRDHLVSLYPEMRTILISGYDLSDYPEQTQNHQLLTKPIDAEQLLAAVAREMVVPPEPESEPEPRSPRARARAWSAPVTIGRAGARRRPRTPRPSPSRGTSRAHFVSHRPRRQHRKTSARARALGAFRQCPTRGRFGLRRSDVESGRSTCRGTHGQGLRRATRNASTKSHPPQRGPARYRGAQGKSAIGLPGSTDHGGGTRQHRTE